MLHRVHLFFQELQAEAELPMAALQKLFDEVIADGPDAPECCEQAEQIWITAHVVAARAYALLDVCAT